MAKVGITTPACDDEAADYRLPGSFAKTVLAAGI
jgi:hypothetical protein